MRNFISIFVMTVCAFTAKAQETMTISWLPEGVIPTMRYGNTSSTTILAMMEFDEVDLINYKLTTKSIIGINQIQFSISKSGKACLSACNVVIMQGKDFATATEVVRQAVTTSTLVEDWNFIDLDSLYNVDLNKKLYIGWEASISGAGYPFPYAEGTERKQGWTRSGAATINNSVDMHGMVFCIKAVAVVDDSPADKIVFSSLDLKKYVSEGDSIAGTLTNIGGTPITSLNITYRIGGVQSTDSLTGLDIAPSTTYSFVHPEYIFDTITGKSVNVVVTISDPNEEADGVVGEKTRSINTIACVEVVPRVVLHEVFTSSTCPPCNPGNVQLMSVLDKIAKNSWACVKYQYNIPGFDPYYTAECAKRGSFYGGIKGVPELRGDGQYNVNPNGYTMVAFDKLADIPAPASMTATAAVNVGEKKVDLDVTINNATIFNSNLRFFAAIVEKATEKNKKTNGEKAFHYVLKKFMTSVDGDVIPLDLNTPIIRDYSYTFNGNYRLPTSVNSLINHATENSVEDFKALMVVYWLQDIVTKEVYQAGKADPHPDYFPALSVEDIALSPDKVVIYPNPAKDNLNILAAEPIKEITIHNLLGQKMGVYTGNITTIPVSELSNGLYIITIKTDNRVINQKFVKQ